MKPVWLITALFALLTATACRDSATYIYTDFRTIPQSRWSPTEPIAFTVECNDSTARRALLTVSVRHDSHYPHRNVALWVDVIDTARHASRNHVNIIIADENGRWCSKGFGSLYEASVTLPHPVNPQAISNVVVWNGLNDSILNGISDIGLSIFKQ